MTTTVALHKPGVGVWIGSDTQYTSGQTRLIGDPKWISLGKAYIGFCGIARAADIVRMNKDAFSNVDDPYTFSEGVSELLVNTGASSLGEQDDDDDDDVQAIKMPSFALSFIFATKKGVWNVDHNLSVMKSMPNKLMAIGSGSYFALGADFNRNDMKPQERIANAIKAACCYDICSGGRSWIHFIPAKEKR